MSFAWLNVWAKKTNKVLLDLASSVYHALGILLVGAVSGAGHTPRSLEFLAQVLEWPFYLIDLVLPRFEIRNPLLGFLLSLIIGLAMYAILGFLIDVAIRMPATLLFPMNLSFGIVWAFAAGLGQYLLVGFLLDKLLSRR